MGWLIISGFTREKLVPNHLAILVPSTLSFTVLLHCCREMFKNTFQSGFLSILYSLGYVPFFVICLIGLMWYALHVYMENLTFWVLVIGANLCRYGIKKVCNFCLVFATVDDEDDASPQPPPHKLTINTKLMALISLLLKKKKSSLCWFKFFWWLVSSFDWRHFLVWCILA